MARRFIGDFLLPLVAGGTLKIGRPLSLSDVPAPRSRTTSSSSSSSSPPAWSPSWTVSGSPAPPAGHLTASPEAALASARRRALAALVPEPPPCTLDAGGWRLGAAAHNLLLLAHPRIAEGRGAHGRIERVAAAASSLAALGAPATASEALARHSLLARLPEVMRSDHTVRFWLGRRTFVGRKPPARMLALPELRAVKVETVRRTWLRDVGVQAVARPAFAALTEASPLGEALFPMRLDPPPSWGRLLSILRFPTIGRLVAGRLVELGAGPAGDALAEALYRFRSLQDTAGPAVASGEAVAFALSFLAHLVWMDRVFETRSPPAGSAFASGDTAGRELAVLLAAASETAPALIWPPDVPRESELGRRFARHLASWFDRHDVKRSARWPAAVDVSEFAGSVARAPKDLDKNVDTGADNRTGNAV